MKIPKNLMAVGLVTGVAAASVAGVASVGAFNGSEERRAEVVDRLSTSLNVPAEDVEAVFEELKAERQAEREAAREERLQGLIDDGTLTQEQVDQLNEFAADRQELKKSLRDSDLTQEEKKEAFEELKAEVEAWADEQGLDLDDIRPEREGRKRGGFGGFEHHSDDAEDADEEA